MPNNLSDLQCITPNAGETSKSPMDAIAYTNSMKTNQMMNDTTDPVAQNITPYDVKGFTAIAINTMVGTGCFSLPYAFYKAGILLTTIILLIGAFCSILAANYMIESLARLDTILTQKESAKVSSKNDTIMVEMIGRVLPPPHHRLTYRQFDYANMFSYLCSPYVKLTAQCILLFYLYCSLWSYASVFPSSLAIYIYHMVNTNDVCNFETGPVPFNCQLYYYIALAVFAIVVIYLALQDLGEQARVQQVLTGYRFVAIIVMLLTISMKLIFKEDIPTASVPMFEVAQLGQGLGPSFLALGFHFCIPQVIRPLSDKSKLQVSLFSAMFCAAMLYIALGILGALAFGEKVNALVSMNWNEYTGCGYGWSTCAHGKANWIGQIIKAFILFFPAINVTSAFPVFSISLADNLITTLPAHMRKTLQTPQKVGFCRLFAVILPVLSAVLFQNLGLLFSIVGLSGFLFALTFPAYFQWSSINKCIENWSKLSVDEASKTSYSLPIVSSSRFVKWLLWFSLIVLTVGTVTLFF